MSDDTLRSLPQAIIAVTTVVFALGMFTYSRAWRRPLWPLKWDSIVALYLASIAFSFGMHTLYWWDIGNLHLDDWELIAPLWIAAAMSTFAMWRWVRTDVHADDYHEGHVAGVADEKSDQQDRDDAAVEGQQ